jgi:hypothetical protein
MLAAELHGVATTESGLQQDVEPNALSRADRPALLICGNLLLGPHRDAGILWSSWISDADSGIDFNELRFCSPPEESAHGFKEMPRLSRCRVSPISARNDCRARDLGVRLLACRIDHMPEYSFALLPRRK